jgi:predicted dehydrogenase
MSGITLALIGGGRWARQYASVLSGCADRVARALWVSRFNRSALDAYVAERRDKLPKFELFADLDEALSQRPDAAIVVTGSPEHASVAERVLQAGIPALVEKPLALTGREARSLIELAKQRDVPLCIALHLLKADFLHHLRRSLADRSVSKIEVEWLDPESEQRWGEVKSVNLAAYKADEAIPHFWSILNLLLDGEEPRLRAVSPQSLGAAEAEFDIGSAQARLVFGRRAAARRRHVSVSLRDGGFAELDFAIEPGRLTIDGVDHPLARPAGVGPLGIQVRDFLDLAAGPRNEPVSSAQLAERCLGSIELMEEVRERLVEEEARSVASRLAGGVRFDDPDISAWVVDNIAPVWGANGIRIEGDVDYASSLAMEAFWMAGNLILSNLPPSESGRVSPSMASAIRESRFFAVLVERCVAAQAQNLRRAP